MSTRDFTPVWQHEILRYQLDLLDGESADADVNTRVLGEFRVKKGREGGRVKGHERKMICIFYSNHVFI